MNEIAFVTGASRGIGKAIAIELLEKGYSVALGYKNNKQLADDVCNLHKNALAVKIDVASEKSIEKAFKKIQIFFGNVDILINNAGISQVKSFESLTDKDWENMWQINFMSAVRCSRIVLPSMIKKRFGRIVNISSIGGQWGGIHQIHYAASKAALINLTKSIAKTYSNYGICCNAVSPGLIETDMILEEVKESKSKKPSSIPVGRYGSPEEVSSLVGFLVSHDASYITGQVCNINGGMNLFD